MKTKINDLGINGEGIARVNNKVVFLPYALPNETVEYTITKSNKNFDIGKVDKVIEENQFRIKPACPYFLECGGCQLQHLLYEKQLDYKTNKVKQTLEGFLKQQIIVENCYASNMIFNYRNKIELFYNNTFGYIKNNKSFINIKNCLLFENGTQLPIIISIFNNTLNNCEYIKSLQIRIINNNYYFTLILSNNNQFKNKYNNKIIELCNKLNILNIIYSLYLCENNNNNSNNITNNILKIKDENKMLELFNLKIYISPDSFLQINNDVSKKIYLDINNEIKNEVVLNAYSGTGLLSAIISKNAKKVFAIELIENATKDANELMRLNEIKNVTNICGDVLKEIDKINEKFESVIIDPPRAGCDKIFLEKLIAVKPKTILYLSCYLPTLGRDIKELLQFYKIDFIKSYDMFPQTSQVETLAKMTLKSN